MQTGGGVEQGDRTVTIKIRNLGSKDVFIGNIRIAAPAEGVHLCVYGRHRLGHRVPDTASATDAIGTETWMVPPGRTEWKVVEVRGVAAADAAEIGISLEYHHGNPGASARVLRKLVPYGDP